jgi:beta-glucosidase
LVRDIASALAREARSKAAHVLLAPTINLHRSVTNGRNFECFAEDPVLTAELCVAYVDGLQAAGVAATPKHLVGNESEFQRMTMSSEVDERTLREVYLVPFEAAVRRAGAWAVMSAYNRLGGIHTSEHPWLLGRILRDEWGFDGVVMSDWFGSHSAVASLRAGLDLEMPGPPRHRGDELLAAVEARELDAALVRRSALNVLRLMQRTGALHDRAAPMERAEDRPEDRALIRRAGAAGMVLLTNDGVLPLPREDGRFAVIGPNALTARIMGGGSAQLNPHHRVSPWDGLLAALGDDARLAFAPGCTNHRFEPVLAGPVEVDYFSSREFTDPPVHRETIDAAEITWLGSVAEGRVARACFAARLRAGFTPDGTGTHRVGIASAGLARVFVDGRLVADAWSEWRAGSTFFSDGCDEVVGTVELEAGRSIAVTVEFAALDPGAFGLAGLRVGIGRPLGDTAIGEAVALARDADTALLFVGRSGEWDTEGSDLPDIRLPGRQNELIAAVAAVNPRTVVVLQTGGPVEMPWIEEVAAVLQAWYPGQEAGHAIADVLFGEAEPGGRLPQSFPRRWADNPTASGGAAVYPGEAGRVHYREGAFIGYRHYDREGVPPSFPFGHGLGYTRVELTDLRVEADRFTETGRVAVTAGLRNVGGRGGVAVVQIYVAPIEPGERPVKELKAFAKRWLRPGAAEEVSFRLEARDFAVWDVARAEWRGEPGDYAVLAGFSSADIRARATLRLPG